MALTWDVTDVLKRDRSDEGWVMTQGLIFTTMSVGINEITKDNVGEFFARTQMVERVDGRTCVQDSEGNPVFTTLADVVRHIGLRTNASPLTRAQFLRSFSRRLDYEANKAQKEAGEES